MLFVFLHQQVYRLLRDRQRSHGVLCLGLAHHQLTVDPPTAVSSDDASEKSGLSVYNGYKGKTIRRKDGFVGTVTDVYTSGGETYLSVHVTGGKDAGKDTKIQLSFMLKNKGVYTVTG